MNILQEILRSRGYRTRAEQDIFLSPDYDKQSHDPFLLPDMQQAVQRLVQAKERREKVVIYGDYDIDGLTASTILLDSFEKFGIEASVYIPNRFVEGYGLAIEAVEKLAEQGAQLIVTVDCGSLSHKEVARGEELGVDIIVTDHHAVATTKSSKVAMINPKWLLQEFPDEYDGLVLKEASKKKLYPFLDLAGCGVAFKLVQALQTRLEGLPKGQEKWLLDLVAFGTVCDVVQLKDENRMFVYWGLRVMARTRRIGLKMLLAVARVESEKLNARSLGFALGPRVNASGRLETAQYALDLLTATDRSRAFELAERLDVMNTERRAEQDRIFQAATEQAARFERDHVLVVSDPSWSHGIIGIVAAKLLEKYQKPTFVLQEMEDGTAKGSARSFGDFSAVDGIRATETLLIKGGGHKLAAGVTLQTERIVEWRLEINKYYRGLKLEDQGRHLLVIADVRTDVFDGFNEDLLAELDKLEPFGNGNPEPVFCIENVSVISRRTMGDRGQHVKYRFSDKNNHNFDMVAWNSSEVFTTDVGEVVSVWCSLLLNQWQGRRSIEGRLLRMEPLHL